jgi:hypothetical protein
MAVDQPPRYPHNCQDCTYLGRLDKYDLYHCPQHGLPTVIACYGAEGAYKSGMSFAKGIDPELSEARRRALALKLRCD